MAKVTALGLTPQVRRPTSSQPRCTNHSPCLGGGVHLTRRTRVQDVYMNLAPLFHIGGVSYALAATLAGAVHVFPAPSASFAPAHRLAEIASYQVTVFIAGEFTPTNHDRKRE
jgi:acyl-CoA synthetase (AMP-forming)/AMP-acid ligase II